MKESHSLRKAATVGTFVFLNSSRTGHNFITVFVFITFLLPENLLNDTGSANTVPLAHADSL